MKRKHTLSQRKFKTDDPKLDLSSLVDVSFLLLIFFLVATSIVRTEKDLTIEQGGERGKISGIEVIRINLDKGGEITLKSGKNEEIVDVSGSDSDILTHRADWICSGIFLWRGQLSMSGVTKAANISVSSIF